MQSAASKIFIVLILLALAGGGALVWWMLSPTPSAAPVSPGQSQSYPGADNSPIPVGTTGSSTAAGQGGSTGPIDYSGTYAALMQAIGGTPVAFVEVGATSTGDYAKLYKLYAADLASEKQAHPTEPQTLLMALVDLTDDGQPEALVYENLMDYCGSGGCDLSVYQKSGSTWKRIYDNLTQGEAGLSNTLTNGHLDLFLTEHGAGGYKSLVERFVWDGTTYKFKEIMAGWDGYLYHLAR